MRRSMAAEMCFQILKWARGQRELSNLYFECTLSGDSFSGRDIGEMGEIISEKG